MRAQSVVLRSEDGSEQPLNLDLWLNNPTPADRGLLGRAVGPVLDVGCGPGRHVCELAKRGVLAMGVDASEGAVGIALGRGIPVLHRSVFDPLPGQGRWGTVLIADGSVGIGGDPVALLARSRELLRAGGCILVEVGPPGSATDSFTARLESAQSCSGWFPWARLSIDSVPEVARATRLEVAEIWTGEGRWFAKLNKL